MMQSCEKRDEGGSKETHDFGHQSAKEEAFEPGDHDRIVGRRALAKQAAAVVTNAGCRDF